ncbi:MAG: ferrous iron transport protein B [Clostridiales Family XIII bacterium]|nr:ferrous iron transport protein B [Clostridiales Family XIII bacterium]
MTIRIALAGNPNSGKTTMFNALTGSSQRVGNWPGVTVEKKEGRLKGRKDVFLQDLPGIYSLSPYTLEEVIARNYLTDEKPDAIINIVDASNIERNLYLTTQLLELDIPVVIALNMADVVRKNGDVIDAERLGKTLGCAAIETSAVKGDGIAEAAQKAIGIVEAAQKASAATETARFYSAEIEEAISGIDEIIADRDIAQSRRWLAVKLFERDHEVLKRMDLDARDKQKIENIIIPIEIKLDDDSESIITDERYAYVMEVVSRCVVFQDREGLTISDRIDRIVTNRFLALPIFALVMFLVYFLSVTTVGAWMTDWVNDNLFGETVPNAVNGWLESLGTAQWLNSLIVDGIIAGVGAVLGFLPQMLTLFLCLALLEDCGYMSRIAFILDRVFRKFGLSGKSFIPMLVGTGCGVPGIMASRTIESDNDRRMTVMTTTFIPCGAKLPIIALIAGALFPGTSWVAPSAYFLGIAAILVSGVMLKKTRLFAGNPSPFVMELPSYHRPAPLGVLRTMIERAGAFVRRAGTIVLVATVLVWFLSGFNTSLQMVETSASMLASLGNIIAPIFDPLGWGDWKAAVATITGLIAKENVVGTFGVLYGFGEVSEDGAEYWSNLVAAFTPLAAYSLLAFNLICAPCFAAIGAIRREMMSAKWTIFAVAYQCGFAYVIALIIYQMGMLASGSFGVGTVVAILFIFAIFYMLFVKKPYDAASRLEAQRSTSVREAA